MFSWFKRILKVPEEESVSFNDVEIIRFQGDKVVESILWESIAEISVVTTDEGPWAEDAYIVFSTQEKDKGCMVPNGAKGTDELVSRICEISGFNESVFISAMGCTSNNSFVCWNKDGIT